MVRALVAAVLGGVIGSAAAFSGFLFQGPLDAAGDLGAWITWEPGGTREYQRHTPSLWWPEDHAWCAGNDIDARFTCIGGPRALSDELLRHPALEVLELDPSRA